MDLEKLILFQTIKEHLTSEEYELMLKAEQLPEDFLDSILYRLPVNMTKDLLDMANKTVDKYETEIYEASSEWELMPIYMKVTADLLTSFSKTEHFSEYKQVAKQEYVKFDLEYEDIFNLQLKLMKILSDESIIKQIESNMLKKILE